MIHRVLAIAAFMATVLLCMPDAEACPNLDGESYVFLSEPIENIAQGAALLKVSINVRESEATDSAGELIFVDSIEVLKGDGPTGPIGVRLPLFNTCEHIDEAERRHYPIDRKKRNVYLVGEVHRGGDGRFLEAAPGIPIVYPILYRSAVVRTREEEAKIALETGKLSRGEQVRIQSRAATGLILTLIIGVVLLCSVICLRPSRA